MLEKLDERHREWLISNEEIEISTLSARGLGNWADLTPNFRELAARRLEFSGSFDYDLTAVGSVADKAVSELKVLFGLQGTTFNNAINTQLICLLANLYLGYQRNHRHLIGISQHHGKAIPERYNPSRVTAKSLVRLKDALLANDYVFFFPGHHARGKTTHKSHLAKIVADPSLIEFLEKKCGWSLATIRYHKKAETIRMRSKRDANKKRTFIPYDDTPDVKAQRKVLQRYNAFMAEQDIQIPTSVGFMRDVFLTRRTFTDESWQLGGRLFGGGFQQLSKEERKRITINGEPVVELDIKSCHATMAFAHVGIDWYAQSNQDLYSRLEEDGWPRDVVKQAFNIMMNAPRRSSAIFALNDQQRKTGFLFDNGMTPFKGWSSDLVSSIQDAYPELEDVFYAELGNSLMNKEGNICLAMVEWGLQEQQPVLTIHDGFLCCEHAATTTAKKVGAFFQNEIDALCVLE